jgi:hypothetical protein
MFQLKQKDANQIEDDPDLSYMVEFQELSKLILTSIKQEKNSFKQLMLLLLLLSAILIPCLSCLESKWPPLHVVTLCHVVLSAVVFVLYRGWMYMVRSQAMWAAYNRVASNLNIY